MIYRIDFDSIVEDYISIERGQFTDIYSACINSEINLIKKELINTETSVNGGVIFPDFYYDGAIPLFSEELFEYIKSDIQKNVFLTDVFVHSSSVKLKKTYKLVVPLRIDCLDKIKSEYKEINGLYDVSKLYINESRTGNFNIFKIKNVLDNNIYVSEILKEKIEQFDPVGLSIYRI